MNSETVERMRVLVWVNRDEVRCYCIAVDGATVGGAFTEDKNYLHFTERSYAHDCAVEALLEAGLDTKNLPAGWRDATEHELLKIHDDCEDIDIFDHSSWVIIGHENLR